METLQAIFSRRSIRQYQDAHLLTEEQIKTLLAAGMQAPSAGNAQDWEFIVVQDREVLNRLMLSHPYAQMLGTAGAAIIVCGNTRQEKYPGFWVQNASAASQNILLAARDMGLGSVWVGVYPDTAHVSAVREILSLPDYVFPLNILPIGYPKEEPGSQDRFNKDKVHLNHW